MGDPRECSLCRDARRHAEGALRAPVTAAVLSGVVLIAALATGWRDPGRANDPDRIAACHMEARSRMARPDKSFTSSALAEADEQADDCVERAAEMKKHNTTMLTLLGLEGLVSGLVALVMYRRLPPIRPRGGHGGDPFRCDVHQGARSRRTERDEPHPPRPPGSHAP